MTVRIKSVLVLACLFLIGLVAQAQEKKTVTGVLTDATGSAVAGVTVTEKGTQNNAVSDASGAYRITVGANATLVFTSVGFATYELKVGQGTEYNAVLALDQSSLNEVVVTALGIKRDKKMLTYASQQVGGDEITRAAGPNFMEAISGKAAGVNISMSNSGAGGSTKAILRGNRSLQGTSEALFVIDGVPMVNNKGGQPGSYGGTDGGDGLSALNPADIESVSILRGANASILYGSQGANGVVLITTKKGKAGKTNVSLNSSTVFERVTSLPDFQYRYGAVNGGDRNWSYQSGNYEDNYINDFFQTGIIATNSVSVSGGNDKTTAYFSYANLSSKGALPTNSYGKNTLSLNQSTKFLNDKLVLSSNVIFSSEKSVNRPGAGYYNNPLPGLYLHARERQFQAYKNEYEILNPTRNMYVQNWYTTYEMLNNPYFEINRNSKLQTNNRVIANVKASYDVVKNLKFDVRANLDYANVVRDFRYAAGGNPVSVSPNGSWNYSEYKDISLYSDAILNYNNNFGNFSLNALVGTSLQRNTYGDGMSVSNGTTPLMYPNVFTFSNFPFNIVFNKTLNSRTLKQGAFASTQFGFKEMIFFDLSARNDWASTLALTGNQSYFYPALGLSAIISEMVQMPSSISFMKVRASYTQTGNEVPFNVVNPANSIGGAGTPSGIGSISRNTQVPFTNLKPEIIKGQEFGAEMKFFKGRFGIDFTYYNTTSTNQFLTLPAPSGSGYTFYYVNAGKIVNKGFEFTIDAEPIRQKNLRWKTSLNGSRNVNKIVELIASNPNYRVGGDSEGFASIIQAGGSFNDLYIYKFQRDDEGRIILDDKGSPTRSGAQEKVGNVNPDIILGWNNTFTRGNFVFNFLVNGKFGGVAFSKTEAFLDYYGGSERSAVARDNGGVAASAVQGSTAKSTIDPLTYFNAVGGRNGIMEPYLFSRTNVRLGQLSLGYTLNLKSGSLLKDATFSIIGRNLFFFYKDAPFDPEQSMSTNNSMQSNDVFSMPPVRSYGFNVKFTL